MNRRIFSLRLMREGMRQVRLVGIIGLVLMVAASLSSTLLFAFRNEGRRLYYNRPEAYEFYEVNPYIILVMYILVPIMVLMLFGFMNKRRASDFYHAIPYTRLCIYTSFFMAAFLWGIIIVFAGVSVTQAAAAVSRDFRLAAGGTVKTVLGIFAGMLLVEGVICFAMSITGTYFTNVLVALMFLFAPRGIISMCAYMLREALPFVPAETGSLLLNSANNIAYGMISYLLLGTRSVFENWTPTVYTFVLAFLYSMAGGALFVVRKSENATRASVNRALQCCLRMIPAMLISLLPIGIIFNIHTKTTNLDSTQLLTIIVAYAAAVLAYFVYEAVTTRKLRNMVRAVPGLFIVAALNAVLIFGLITDYNHELELLPETSELEYVVIEGPSDDILWKQAGEVKLYSDEAKKFTVDCLADTLDKWENDRYGTGGFYNGFYMNNMKVRYHYSDGSSIVRQVIMSDTRYAQMKRVLAGEEKFVNAFSSGLSDLQDMSCQISGLDELKAEAVYRTFLSEVKGYDFGRMFDVMNYTKKPYFFGISLRGRFANSMNAYSYIYVDAGLPNTFAAYAREINREYPDNEAEMFLEYIENIIKIRETKNPQGEDNGKTGYLNANLNVQLYTVDSDYSLYLESNYINCYYDESGGCITDEEGRRMLARLADYISKAKEIRAGDIKPGTHILSLNCGIYKEAGDSYRYDGEDMYAETAASAWSDEETGWYVIDEAAMELIQNILHMNVTYY